MLADGEKVYRSLNLDFKVAWFPVLHLLANHDAPMTLTQVAGALGLAHPSVIEVTEDMTRKRLIVSKRSQSDKRQRLLSLTSSGKRICSGLEPLWEAFKRAGEEITLEDDNNFLESIKKMERAMERRSFYERIITQLNI
jgi:DNA-binding MarR family transcriptional regulator